MADHKKPTTEPAGKTPTQVASSPDQRSVARVERAEQANASSGDNGAAPPVSLAPMTAEDPTRMPKVDRAAPQSFPGYPKTKYHPVYGASTSKDPNEALQMYQPAHNWFDTAEEADAHRTDREAQQVIHANRSLKVQAALSDEELPIERVRGEAGVVRNSVAATESVKAGNAEPL